MPYQSPESLGMRVAGTGPSVLESVIGGAGKAVDSYFDNQEKQFKKEKEKTDMYIALRKAGYSGKAAFNAVERGLSTLGSVMPGESETDLDLKIKKATLAEKEASTEYKKKQTERTIATTPLAVGENIGYDKVGDIPNYEGYDKHVKQDKKTGKYFVEYTTKKATSGDALGDALKNRSGVSFDEEDGGGASQLPKINAPLAVSPASPANFLLNIVSKIDSKAMADEQKTSPGETKVIRGVTYKRGSDGKWHKQG